MILCLFDTFCYIVKTTRDTMVTNEKSETKTDPN